MQEWKLPRLPRIHLPGGFYHVYARGNGKQAIFLDHADRLRWEKIVCEGLQRYNHLIHAYCWMTNHVHMLIQAGEKPLAYFVSSLLSRYAKSLNRKTARSGHVFERRHGEKLVKDDGYLLELVRYIHQNPQRAGIVSGVGDYKWCSHQAYVGLSSPEWLTTELVLSQFGRNMGSARQAYCKFIVEKQPESVADEIRGGSSLDPRLLGDNEWLNKVLQRADVKPEFETLDQIVEEFCRRNGITEARLVSSSRSRTHARIRAEIALVATDCDIASMTEVAQRFRRSLPVISRAVARLRISDLARATAPSTSGLG